MGGGKKPNIMAFNGKEGGSVSVSDAGEWTAAFRNSFSGETKGVFFGKDILNDILDQSGCMGIRMYNAVKGGKMQLVLVGTDSEENDQLGATDIVADLSVLCPPTCGGRNDLNS